MIQSVSQSGVRYHLDKLAREGGMGQTYFARRESAEGTSPVVVKLMRAEVGRGIVSPEMVANKETVALGRLNDCVPPTPFVVRLLDSGTSGLESGYRMPWTVIEYVHGGVEGTTLEERVTYSLNKTSYGFTPQRAAHLLRCLSSGLAAVHGVKVLHRDLSPSNVLCCGFGETEIFKLSDFGVARVADAAQTFHGAGVGTLGYSAPEATDVTAGPHSDVFSLACVVYFALTGRHYFNATSPGAMIRALLAPSRPSILDHVALHPELQHDAEAALEIDASIEQATSDDPKRRPQAAKDFARNLLDALGRHSGPARSSRRLVSAVVAEPVSPTERFSWVVRSRPRPDVSLRSAAWDTDGRAFALTADGAQFWNGHTWVDASRVLSNLPGELRFVKRYEAGGWLVGGLGAALSVLDASGVSDTIRAPGADLSFCDASGRLDDLLVAIGETPGKPPLLCTLVARRWMKPVAVTGAKSIATLSRLDDERWIVAGTADSGGAFAAIFSPLQHDIEPIVTSGAGSLVASASVPERATAILVGRGQVLRVADGNCECTTVGDRLQAHAAAVDIVDREWVGGVGALWCRRTGGPWAEAWRDERWSFPFCALLADAGMIAAITVNGGIVEGRAE